MESCPVALVTGSTRGIGKVLSESLLASGYRVVGCSRSAKASIEHERYEHHAVDVTDERAVSELFSSIRARGGRLDVAINNAAVNQSMALVAMTQSAAASQTINTNILGTFLVCRESVKLMMRRKYGRIITMSSMAARLEVPGEAIYAATKVAVETFTRILAREVFASGITCNVVAPAAVPTDLLHAVDPDKLAEVLKRNAIPTIGTAEEVCRTVAWLISPEAGYITSQVIYHGGV